MRVPVRASCALAIGAGLAAGTIGGASVAVAPGGATAPATAPPARAAAPSPAPRLPPSYAELLAPALAAIVRVTAVDRAEPPIAPGPAGEKLPAGLREFFEGLPSPRPRHQVASGFAIDAAGHVATAFYVVAKAATVTVRLPDGRDVAARIVGADEESGVAVLQVDAGAGLAPLEWADAVPRVGDPVFAIGHPYGLGPVVTQGMLGGVLRPADAGDDANPVRRELLATDAVISLGFAGGPLLDAQGRVVGLLDALLQSGVDRGLTVATPGASAREIVRELVAHERVRRARLGVEVAPAAGAQEPAGNDAARAHGVRVAAVTPDSPAARAGLQADDVLLRADGEPLASEAALRRVIAGRAPGASLEIAFQRDGRERAVVIVLDEAR